MEDTVSVAMLVLRSGKGLNARDIFDAWRKLWPNEPVPENPKKDGATLSFDIGIAGVVISAMPAPIPASDVQTAVMASWMWPEAAAAVAGHRAHAIVAVMGNGLPTLERMVVLTRVMSALIEAGDVSAVYWGAAGMLCEPSEFVSTAREALEEGSLPVTNWVNMVVSQERGRSYVSTAGMRALGHKEMEIIGTKAEPSEAMDFLGGIVGYVLENGPILKHGETIGFTAKQKVKIRHVSSHFSPEHEVIQLGF